MGWAESAPSLTLHLRLLQVPVQNEPFSQRSRKCMSRAGCRCFCSLYSMVDQRCQSIITCENKYPFFAKSHRLIDCLVCCREICGSLSSHSRNQCVCIKHGVYSSDCTCLGHHLADAFWTSKPCEQSLKLMTKSGVSMLVC